MTVSHTLPLWRRGEGGWCGLHRSTIVRMIVGDVRQSFPYCSGGELQSRPGGGVRPGPTHPESGVPALGGIKKKIHKIFRYFQNYYCSSKVTLTHALTRPPSCPTTTRSGEGGGPGGTKKWGQKNISGIFNFSLALRPGPPGRGHRPLKKARPGGTLQLRPNIGDQRMLVWV